MKTKLVQTLLLVIVILVLPLLPKPRLFLEWPVWFSLLAGVLLNFSQPAVPTSDLKADDALDRRSVLLIYVSGSLMFLIPILDFAYGMQTRPQLHSVFSRAAIVLTFLGLAFRYWSIRTLGKYFTGVVKVEPGQTVVDKGPYKYLRHPSYLGSFAMAVGVSLMFRSLVGLLACFVIFFPTYVYRIRREEAALLRELGEPYAQYMKRTYRMVPFLY